MLEQVKTAIEQLLSQKARPIVFVTGLGGSGKTTLCRHLEDQLEVPTLVLESDWYLKYSTDVRVERLRLARESGDQERIAREENPQHWYQWPLFCSGIEQLRDGGQVQMYNAWSQKTGNRELDIQLGLPKEGPALILCDGIYLLHPAVAELADFRILLDVEPEVAIERSRNRDAHRSSEEHAELKTELLRRYDLPYFEKYRSYADLCIPSVAT